ncbi:hypothetical protein [Antrihabitans sp. YC2-6]|uniref:hypothetical protein n=1 Tax=Antrihabitans sp. YC2-6 TaxID=2799498 RepID=UPI0018F48B3B|nr:hypothetical protein [Antrihabitans sp. YC2-6]MBJ8348339.1 hypothetical protein [Antrihabitans sp. YC2-6]
MLRFSLRIVTFTAALGLALTPALSAYADPADPGSACGPEMVVNTHGQCLPIGSFCSFSDGMIIGTLGTDGRCVLPGTNI